MSRYSTLLCLLAMIFFVVYGADMASAQGDIIDQLTWSEWSDGLLVEKHTVDYATSEVIHLDRVLSTFENGWGTSNPGYYFDIIDISALDSNDADDTVNAGSFFDVDDNGDAFPSAFTAPHRLNNSQGLLRWLPSPIDHEQNLRVHFTLYSEATNATKACTLLIQRYLTGCVLSALKDSRGNTVYAPPVPTCRIHYDRTVQRFTLNVTGAYLTDQSTYLIDFDDFNAGNSNYGGNNLRQNKGTCASRDDIGNAAAVPFIEMWYAAPTATFPHSLDGSYPAYHPRSTWSVSTINNDCSQVYFNTSYSFTNLTHCKKRDDTYAVALTTRDGMLMYTGNVYVNILVPIDLNHEEWGYTKFRNVYPFEFGFKQRMTALVGVPSEEDIRVFVRSAQLDSAGILTLTIETQYARPDGLNTASVSPTNTHIALTSSADACNGAQQLCIQLWQYGGSVAWDPQVDDGTYTLTWQAIDDGHPISVVITLAEKLQEVQSETGLDIGSLQLRVFNTSSDMQLGQNAIDNTYVFDPRDTVFVRADLMVPTADEQNFGLVIENAYLCYSAIEGYQIEYSENGKQGCLDPFILDTERFQLINNTVAITTPQGIDFSTNLMSSVSTFLNPTGPSDVFSFVANPQQEVDRIYTIHLECYITQRTPTKRSVDDDSDPFAPRIHIVSAMPTQDYARNVEFTTQSHNLRDVRGAADAPPAASVSFGIRRTQTTNANPSSSSSFTLIIAAGVCVALAAVMAVGFFIWKRNQANRVVVYSPVVSDSADLEIA